MRNLPASYNVFTLVDDFLRDGSLYQNVLRVDFKENDKEYIVHADVPGAKKEDIAINFDKGVLTIEVAERSERELKEGEKYLFSERSLKKQIRRINVEDKVEEDEISAEFKDGVLSLTLPKRQTPRAAKSIEIK